MNFEAEGVTYVALCEMFWNPVSRVFVGSQ